MSITSNQFLISSDELLIKPIGYKREEMDQLVVILKDQLELSLEQQFELCFRFYVENKQAKYFVNEERLFRFMKIKQTPERKKLFQQALLLMAKMPPADVLATLSVRRRAPRRNGKENTEQYYKPNDVPLDNTLIFTLFTSYIGPTDSGDKENKVIILFPSAFFVRKWLNDPLLRKKQVCFVFNDRAVCETLAYHYHEADFGRTAGGNVSFLSLSDWRGQIQQGCLSLSDSHILAFFCGVPVEKQERIYKLLYQQAEQMDLFLVLGSYEFEQARSPFSVALEDPRFCFRSIELLPQGLNNIAFPRRKMLVQAEILNQPAAVKEKILITVDALNTDFKTQAVVRSVTSPVSVESEELNNLYLSIRQLYDQELMSRDSSGSKRTQAFSFPFTPDISIWCSKTYPKNNQGRPRLEAYFCEITPKGKVDRGGVDRGAVLVRTKKRIVKLSDHEILSWLNMTYPFSFVRERTSGKKAELNDYYYSIQENAIEYYTDALAGENLALKTFWYLYPNLKDLFSESDYRILNTMVSLTEIGYLRLQDIQIEEVESILEYCFPNDSEGRLFQRFRIISKVIDRAIELDYCTVNPLAQAILDVKKRDKLFSQIRKALTKKHFTQAEFQQVYRIAASNLKQGKLEYTGVLLRLMTGLSANVICGLKWKDLITIEDYGIQKLMIVRQVVNDGSGYKGFESLEDYLCFPCSDLLSQYLGEAYELTKRKYPAFSDFCEWPIVRQTEAVNKRGGGKAVFAPRDLEALCKQLVIELSLPERIVIIPDQGEGTKETNLNSYGGDFFRENFRFWSLAFAGMTNDEIAYLIGNTPETTFGRYYCDFLNDASQYLLYMKLRRIDAMMSENGEKAPFKERTTSKNMCENVLTGSSPANLQLRISCPPKASQIELKIESDHAFSVSADFLS